jgi:Na+-transporting NADH:ubiquinone oxidoreductase subunit NqrD
MITMGIMISHWKVIPELYKGTFFISLGLSLLASSIFYIIEGVQFVIQVRKEKHNGS